MNRFLDQNYYELLEIPMDTPQQEIRKAYQRAKTTYASNSPALYTMFTNKEVSELNELIEEAFRVLGNQALRQEYDMKLRREGTTRVNRNFSDLPSSDSKIKPLINVHKKSFIPEGFKKTKLSIYKVDQDFEEKIKSETSIDGDFLKRVRLYKNIPLNQISDETRINVHYLKAIEEGHLKHLPAPVFVRGFIQQMARLYGLSEEKATASYMKIFDLDSEEAG